MNGIRFSLLLIVCTLVLNVPVSSAQFLNFENPLIGKKAPDFTLDVVGGAKTNFTKFRDGDPAIIFFWATWCPHCRTQLMEMNEQVDEFKKKNIKMVLVDLGEKEKIVERYLTKKGIRMPVFLDTRGELEQAYQIMGVPTFFFVNAEGVIVNVQHSLPAEYEEMLKKK